MSATGIPDVLKNSGLSREVVEAIVKLHDEPEWLVEKRLQAWEVYENTPMPTVRDESWRYTDISDIDPEEFVPYAPSPDVSSQEELPQAVQDLLSEGEENSALLVQHNSETTYSRIDEDLSEKGVIFTDLHTALREHEEIVKDKLFGQVPAGYDKFAALSSAAFSGGSFLYVPKGVNVEVPIQSYRWMESGEGVAVMPRTLVVIEEGASVVYIDEFASSGDEEDDLALSAASVELFVEQGANLRYVCLQNWGRNVVHFNNIRSAAGRDATINSLVISLGGDLSRTNVEAGLTDEGANSEMLGLYFADSEQVIDHHTLQDHLKPNAYSDLLYKGAVRDDSLAVFSGLIKVEPDAQKTDAYQTNRNLILGSEDAMAVSLPRLEIEADDVRCSHGSTTGQVDETEIFYLMSRGIPRREAEKLVVYGFFGDVTSRIKLSGVKEKLDRAIEEKIGSGFDQGAA